MKATATHVNSKTAPPKKIENANQAQSASPLIAPEISGSIPILLQKSICPCDGGCPGCRGNNNVQLKQRPGKSQAVNNNTYSRIQSLKGGGQPLPASTRSFFEPRFGHNFSSVRIHTGGIASEAAATVSAKAFTLGNDIVFGSNQYAPGSVEGKRLMAHELTHVIQQQSIQPRIQRINDRIVECMKLNPLACIVHLHGNEADALETAENIYCRYCVNLVRLTNSQDRVRLMRFEVDGTTCCADPNRLFDTDVINTSTDTEARREWNNKWEQWNNGNNSCNTRCHSDPTLKANAFQEARRKSNALMAAISRCNRSSQLETNPETSILPTLALHNNTDLNLSIYSYRAPNGREYGKGNTACYNCPSSTSQDQQNLTEAFTELNQNPENSSPRNPPENSTSPSQLQNPHIQNSQDRDDFMLVTDWQDFVHFVRMGRNVVLQAHNPARDGSLSVEFTGGRYINIEAQHSHYCWQQQTANNTMARNLGIPQTPCQGEMSNTPDLCPNCESEPRTCSNPD